MTLRLYDTRARAMRDFFPVVDGRVSIYYCGPTVQAAPHVGHLRSAVDFDLLRRWLTASGYPVVLARNVTDIDDKILHAAEHEGSPYWAIAERNLRAFARAYDALGVLPPTVEPKATGHIPQIVALIEQLIEARRAYAADGDVYFDVRSLASYGELSGQRPAAMLASADAGAKRDPLDFALWKSAKPGEPAWATPWGAGRPGWHVECTAMATHYFGPEFDIHGGGLDLIFPHHENELAQAAGAGQAFARFWMHNGMLNVGAEKMSKSLGNSLVIDDVLQATRPQALRYYLAAPHYRSTVVWSRDSVAEADAAYTRLETFVRKATDALGGAAEAEVAGVTSESGKAAWDDFSAAMDDDLGTPRAFGVLHSAARAGNAVLTGDPTELAGWLDVVRRMLEVLGLDPVSQWPSASSQLEPVVDSLVALALQARQDARSRRDYAAADAIRDGLTAAGITVEDTAGGARWRLAGR